MIGTFGDFLSGIMFGLFGSLAYIFPICLFVVLALWYANPGNPYVTRKIISGSALFVTIQMLFQFFADGGKMEKGKKIGEIYNACKDGKNGGGAIAGSLTYFLNEHLGSIGTILLILLFAAICLVLLTGKSLIKSVKNGSDLLIEKGREENERRKEYSRLRQMEMEEKRLRWEEQQALKEEKRAQKEEERRQRELLREQELEAALERAREKANAEPLSKDEDEEYAEPQQDIAVVSMTKGRIHENENKVSRKEEKENERALRMDKKSTGIIFDNVIPKPQDEKRRDDVHEIVWNEEEASTSEEENELQDQEELIIQQTMNALQGSTKEAVEEPINFVNIHKGGVVETVAQSSSGFEMVSTFEEEEVKPREVSRVFENRKEELEYNLSESSNRTDDGRVKAVAPKTEEPKREVPVKESNVPKVYNFPPLSRLQKSAPSKSDSSESLKETAQRLQQTLNTFGVKVTITDISQGPSVTRYELQPEQGVKVSKIVGLSDDIKLNLAATDIRIEAPIPGKAAIGIEVPNKENSAVSLRDLLESNEFKEFPSNLAFAVGKDIGGQVVVTDIAKMPHVLIAGATGSGKSVCINTIIMSILYKAHPDDVKLIMIDPKVVELSVYNGIPHLLIPVVTDPKKASGALHWGVAEMTERYKKFADFNVRDLKGYNKKVEAMKESGDENAPKKMPQIVIIVDELADLMMVCPGEVEESICRLAQLARAAGIHLILATQRPIVDVITGLIKATMPSRTAFSVSSGVDSRTILDMNGAEKLLGKGVMLFYPQGYTKPARIQGAFVSDKEVSDVVDFLKNQCLGNTYAEDIEDKILNSSSLTGSAGSGGGDERDEYFEEAGKLIIDKDKASIGMLQRAFKVGFNRAARIMDQLCEYGVVGEEEGTKPRKVLMSLEQFEELLEEI